MMSLHCIGKPLNLKLVLQTYVNICLAWSTSLCLEISFLFKSLSEEESYFQVLRCISVRFKGSRD